MSKVWHISDVHLSFLEDGTVRKPMHLRKWAKGVPAYENYLQEIQAFASANIREEDFTVITGDILHDMKFEFLFYSLEWLRTNIKGTIVICRGNHDKYWDPGYAKQDNTLKRFHIIDEGEMSSIGPYMFGCYSDHDTKTEDMIGVNKDYVSFGKNLAVQAAKRKKKAVFISHYPVSKASAEEMTRSHKLYAYLSGHVHCTSNDMSEAGPSGIVWKWYNFSAKHTDDKNFNGCYFSTGTTDVLLAKHGQIFKEIETLRCSSINKKTLNILKNKAVSAFKCPAKLATTFEKVDPFNPQNTLAGFINRKKGNRQGSLYVTHVNGISVAPQFIHGTPKLEYPYKDTSDKREYKDIDAESYMIAEKWNGMNVCFYKYQDATGTEFITAKSKGTPFLTDSDIGNFLTLTKEAMVQSDIFDLLQDLKKGKDQSMTFELCGIKEPHLVKYDFDIKLKPLFITRQHGGIKPADGTIMYSRLKGDNWQSMCKRLQEVDYEDNVTYRLENSLEHKYEYEHFATEGKVLFCLDKDGYVIDRTMYKIKPQDIEEVHWQRFDAEIQERVKEAVRKIHMNEEAITEETLRHELDMGGKEWGKFGKQVLAFANSDGNQEARVVMLCGLPGSGKSTVAKIMAARGWIRINQDELGSRGACSKLMRLQLEKGKNVVIDRCNFDAHQRKSFIDIAIEGGVSNITCVHLKLDPDECLKRAAKRKDHPSIKNEEGAKKAIRNINKDWTDPESQEGFIGIKTFDKPMAADEIAKEIMG